MTGINVCLRESIDGFLSFCQNFGKKRYPIRVLITKCPLCYAGVGLPVKLHYLSDGKLSLKFEKIEFEGHGRFTDRKKIRYLAFKDIKEIVLYKDFCQIHVDGDKIGFVSRDTVECACYK